MEPFNYVCTQLERVDELLAMLVLLHFVLVLELGFLTRSSRWIAKIASQRLELQSRMIQRLNQPLDVAHLNEARNQPQTFKLKGQNDVPSTSNVPSSAASSDKDEAKKDQIDKK